MHKSGASDWPIILQDSKQWEKDLLDMRSKNTLIKFHDKIQIAILYPKQPQQSKTYIIIISKYTSKYLPIQF